MSGQDDLRGIAGISELAHERRDEVDLIDLWIIFVRYWVVFATIVTVGVAAGVAYALLRTESYTYSTLIEIGTRIVGDETQLIESPDSVLAKVKDGYRLMELREYYAAHPEDTTEYDVDVSVPQKADLLIIEDRKPEDKETAVQAIHAGIVARLEADHNRIITVIRKQLENRLANTANRREKLAQEAELLTVELERLEQQHQNKLAILDEQIVLLKTELQRLDESARIVNGQIAEMQRLTSEAEANRERAIKEATDEARAMTLLLINDELQRNRQMLVQLLERSQVGIPNQRSSLSKQIEERQRQKLIAAGELANERDRFLQRIQDNRRAQAEVEGDLEALQLQLDNLRSTRAIATAAQSVKPAGPRKAFVVFLSGLFAGFIGLLAVIVLHMRGVIRRRSASA